MPAASGAVRAAGLQLLGTYASLAERGEHLFGSLLAGEHPTQWAHYPEDDAIDPSGGFQWFYHSHSPQDRSSSAEHGHIHLFARRKRWSRFLSAHSESEVHFSRLEGAPIKKGDTRHLLAIGFDAKGLPTSLFTVNSWVTGDSMLSASSTAALLGRISLNTGHPHVDAVVQSVIRLYAGEIRGLLEERDRVLFGFAGSEVLADESLEILSELSLDLDGKLAGELAASSA
ncbi:hypothetical protein [Pandoraea sp. E26]|uniref:DUF6969 family protein n=1 Tax=Pandoraea sp. E26 TaxID=1427365 RepID=UPI00068F4D64|nr:hypothetical protein [Pandoraea sp. E26]